MTIPDKPTEFAVDADIIAYKVSAVTALDEDPYEKVCDKILNQCINNIATASEVSTMRFYLSPEKNFRYEVAKTREYKATRKGLVRPRHLEYCKQYLRDNYKAVTIEGYEADDCIVSDMVKTGSAHCGIDKDMKQVSGWHYNYVKDIWEYITKDEATLRLYRQILSGDSSDNIPGLPRVGPKTAEKVITKAPDALSQSLEYYKEIYDKSDVLQDTLKDLFTDVEDNLKYIPYWDEQKKLLKLVTSVSLPFDNTVVVTDINQEDGFTGIKEGIEYDDIPEDDMELTV